jgi:hypothetical protein
MGFRQVVGAHEGIVRTVPVIVAVDEVDVLAVVRLRPGR